jgi:hypothetical protein
MHIERKHHVGKEEAIGRISTLLDDLMRRPFPGGITVKEISRNRTDNILNFSFKAKKGFMGTTISGVIRIDDDSAVMDFDVPGFVMAFVSEKQICDAIDQEWNALFPA